MNTYAMIILIVLAIVAVALLIIFLFPKFHNIFKEKETKTAEEIATDEVTSIVYDPKKHISALDDDIQKDKDINFIEIKEKELNIIFTEDDIEALLVQIKQDRLDDIKK